MTKPSGPPDRVVRRYKAAVIFSLMVDAYYKDKPKLIGSPDH